MKNKELVKQLEGVGFASKVSGGIRISLEVKGGYAFDYYEGDDRIHFYKDNETVATSIESPMFAQIVAKVKDITGVDLAKKTKREEIEELKDCIAEMGEEKHRTWERLAVLEAKTETLEDVFKAKIEVPLKMMQDAVKSQNDAIEANKKEAYRANDRLTMVLRRLKVLGVWKDEEPDKQASEMQAEEKKAFEVGDRVVISEKAKGLYGFQIEAMHTQTPLTIRKVIDTQPKGYECEYLDNHVGTFPAKWLDEPAPAESPKEKAMEFGKPYRLGIVSESAEEQGYKQGDVVVYLGEDKGIGVARYIKEGCELRCTGKENLKPL